jgi:hypothetical protein
MRNLNAFPDMMFLVLSTKDKRPSKGKDYEIAKWEEEVRKSLATKKAGSCHAH